jgi:creatinine amidohydrolase
MRKAKVLLLPALPYGVDSNLLSYPFTMHVSQATLDAMIAEIAASVRHHGIRKFVIVNGHGGNDFVPLVRQLQHTQDIFSFLCDWWRIGQDNYSELFEAPDDHAGEMETSIALALYPERVALENAKDGKVRPFGMAALNAGWVKTSRDFGRLNDHCAAGDPSKASAEKGRRYLELAVRRLGDFLVELAGTEIDEHFPFQRDYKAD